MIIEDYKVRQIFDALVKTSYELSKIDALNTYNVCKHCGGQVFWQTDVIHIIHEEDCIIKMVEELDQEIAV